MIILRGGRIDNQHDLEGDGPMIGTDRIDNRHGEDRQSTLHSLHK